MGGLKKALEGKNGGRLALAAAVLGLLLLLLPSAGEKQSAERSEEERLEELLEHIEGVGKLELLVSEQGAAVVCTGADNAQTALNICRAVHCYTGLTMDKIQIFKMETDLEG